MVECDITQLHRLACHRIRARDHGLRRDHRCGRGQHHHRNAAPFGDREVERIAYGFGMREHQGTLSQVVQHQRRQYEKVPAVADRLWAKMAHVGVQRLTTRDCQNDRSEDKDRVRSAGREKPYGPAGVQCLDHLRVLADVDHADRGQREEPEQHHRPEYLADLGGAEALRREQQHQHHDRQRHDPVTQLWRGDSQPFDRRQGRDRRGDHAIAEKKRSPEDAEDAHDVTGTRSARQAALHQCHQRHDAAFALVVGAHDDGDVFQRDHDHQRPEHQREDA
jgi:hypothetical protein